MRKILLTVLGVMLALLVAEDVRGQQTEAQPEQSQEEFGPREGQHFSVSSVRGGRDLGQTYSIAVHPLFTVELRTDISLEGRCYYYLEDPCSVFYEEVINYARNELLSDSADLLESMLEERGFEQTLRQSISYAMRRKLLELRRKNGNRPVVMRSPGPPESPLPHPERYPRPDSRRLLLGTLLFAGGGVLSASKNDWVIDEGYVGVAVAGFGLAMVFKQLVPEWRGARIGLFGTGMSIAW